MYKKYDNRKCPNCNSDNITYDKSHSVAEFLILPNYRRNHIGKRVAFDVFKKAPIDANEYLVQGNIKVLEKIKI